MSLQMKYQKIISMLNILAAALFFVLGLGFCTNLYTLYYFIDPSNVWYVPGSEIYYNVQGFNHLELKLAIVLILLACAQYITLNHSRRKYYISNYVTAVAYSGFAIYVAQYVSSNAAAFKEQFLTTVDFTTWKMWVEVFEGLAYDESTFWFDAASVIALIGIAVAVLNILNLVWKTISMVRESKAVKACGMNLKEIS